MFGWKRKVPEKILIEFSLTPESRQRLQEFLDTNLENFKRDLRLYRDSTQQQLNRVIQEIFPKEALKELKKIIKGKSEYALLIHNCPERNTTNDINFPADTYCYYISRAFYEIFGTESVRTGVFKRRKGDIEIAGGGLHSDLEDGGKIVTFSAPLNLEEAPTTLIRKKSVFTALPSHRRIEAVLKKRAMTLLDERFSGTPKQLEEKLKSRTVGYEVDLDNVDTDRELVNAVAHHKRDVFLGPGDILVFDKDVFLHKANPGDRNIISHQPSGTVTRVFFDHSAAPIISR